MNDVLFHRDSAESFINGLLLERRFLSPANSNMATVIIRLEGSASLFLLV
jgi:hypothetical protein